MASYFQGLINICQLLSYSYDLWITQFALKNYCPLLKSIQYHQGTKSELLSSYSIFSFKKLIGFEPRMLNSFTRLTNHYVANFQVGQRFARCLSEFLWCSNSDFNTLVGATVLAKCFRAGLWEDSPFVSKQFEGVGIAYSSRWALKLLLNFSPVAKPTTAS
jgi:hypothetical protein